MMSAVQGALHGCLLLKPEAEIRSVGTVYGLGA